MHKTRLVLTWIVTGAVGMTLLLSPAGAEDARQTSETLDKQVPVKLDYLLYLPPDYEKKDAWPLIVFLHGAGERGSDLEKVKVHGPPKLIENGKDIPAIVVSPQCPGGQWWSKKTFELSALIDDIESKYKVDKRRVYLTGLSMGGFGTWSLAAQSPGRFAALVPICGGGDPRDARFLRKTPIWVFHGGKDSVVPPQLSEEMVEALERIQGNVKLTIYPEASHDSWTATYDDPVVWKWMFEQQLSDQ